MRRRSGFLALARDDGLAFFLQLRAAALLHLVQPGALAVGVFLKHFADRFAGFVGLFLGLFQSGLRLLAGEVLRCFGIGKPVEIVGGQAAFQFFRLHAVELPGQAVYFSVGVDDDIGPRIAAGEEIAALFEGADEAVGVF